MNQKIVILVSHNLDQQKSTDLTEIGQVVTEISHLYQIVREQDIDLVMVDEGHHDFRRAVALRIRRYNGLTEIWKLVSGNPAEHTLEPFLDGFIPFDLSGEALDETVEKILHAKALLRKYQIVGRSAQMKLVAETIERIAVTDVSVLIVGPSGSGKELVAHAIHEHSLRSEQPFVAVNCGALAQGILESELFGHEKGAFTGSVSRREGLFHKANGGSIFLDEIGETSPEMQVKLLRVLEDGTYYPVGSSEARRTDVRAIAATNRDLAEAIAEKEFREDLYFRLGVVKVILPPLLDRKEDIQPLLRHFWGRNFRLDYSDKTMALLLEYDWPGNVRQLKNFADRMKALKPEGLIEVDDVRQFYAEQQAGATNLPVATGKTTEEAGQELIYRAILQLGGEVRLLRDLITSHLPGDPTNSDFDGGRSAFSESSATMEEMEFALIRKTLAETDGNRKEAARRLGISERTLYRKISKYDLR
ncbi:MAG: sigma-54 dependent transcriptional regulator [bacterium]|nr:sigma-54 dependent transcriptional regulator [bacterium]